MIGDWWYVIVRRYTRTCYWYCSTLPPSHCSRYLRAGVDNTPGGRGRLTRERLGRVEVRGWVKGGIEKVKGG